MARQIAKLTARQVDTIKKPGRHSDGGNLFLVVDKPTRKPDGKEELGARRWVFLFRTGGRLREMGFGGTSGVTLARARELAQIARTQIAEGLDPIEVRRREEAQGSATFGEVAKALHASRKGTWTNAKSEKQWLTVLETHCAKLWSKAVDEIDVADVIAVLRPLWTAKPETAKRCRSGIEATLDAARVRGLVPETQSNPAQWKGRLSMLLPKRAKLSRGHHKALPFADVPAFVATLRQRPAIAARCLEFTLLTAARSQEAIRARWAEIDLDKKLWSIPGTDPSGERRMKSGLAHAVPLSDRAAEILREMAAVRVSDHPFVFPGAKANAPLSVMGLEMLLRRLQVTTTTVHGLRSSFRDWAGEATTFPRELAELSLAHQVGNAVERSYRRGSGIERRREMMAAWADFCGGNSASAQMIDLASHRKSIDKTGTS